MMHGSRVATLIAVNRRGDFLAMHERRDAGRQAAAAMSSAEAKLEAKRSTAAQSVYS